MGERSGIDRSGRGIGGKRRRHRSLGDIDLAFRKIGKGRRRHTEVLRQHLGRRVSDPIADAEGAELGEITIVEYEHEQAVLGADALDRVAEPAREVPHIASSEVGDLRLTLRVDGGDAALALDHVGPFRCIGVPVQLAQPARIERHQHTGELLGDREFRDRRFFRPAAVPGLGRDCAELEAKGRQLGAGQHRRGRSERRLSFRQAIGAGCSGDHAAGGRGAQHVAP
jgi:hypothetical protein